MKHVVIISPDFLPSNYPPALRTRLFAQHLPAFGWQPTVVTVEPHYYEWPVDTQFGGLLPDSLHLIRTPALPQRLTRKIGIGDIGLRSLWHHWRAAEGLCRNNKVDLVFISLPPYFSAVLGRMIYAKHKLPYVIDYIDRWVTLDYWRLSPAQRPLKRTLSYALSRVLELFALKYVSHIVGVSKATIKGVICRYQWLTEGKTTEIPYGGEPADFDYLRENPRKNKIFNRSDGLLHISYVGRGGQDMHSALKAVFQAIKLGLGRLPEIFTKLCLHFVGTTYAPGADSLYQVLPLAEEFGLQDYVQEYPCRVPYLDALQILLDSHALLVIGSDRPHYTASKIFPYILARKPLLAIFHEASSVIQILRETQAGEVITFNPGHPAREKVEEISRRLEEILLLPPDYHPPTDWEAFESYTAKAMAARLAGVFDKVLLEKQIVH